MKKSIAIEIKDRLMFFTIEQAEELIKELEKKVKNAKSL
jgi:hypothetical protein